MGLLQAWGLCYLLSPYRWWQQGAASWLNLFLPLCLKVGTEGSEFCSVCICLLPLLTAVLPALQPGVSVRAGQWDNQMQTSHEGMYSSVQKSKWHHSSLHTGLIKPELNYATQWWQSCLKCVYLGFFKSVLPLFRCLTTIERNVEQCQISISSTPTDQVMIQFFCRHGRKHYCILYYKPAAGKGKIQDF